MRGHSSTYNPADRFGQLDRGQPDHLAGTLFHWCVIEVAVGSRVVVGVRVGRCVAEVSSLLASFHPSSRSVMTFDGAKFYLDGALDSTLNSRVHWMDWLQAHGFDGLVDVSQEYITAMQRGLQ
ncbi:MAG: hypothetical protein V4844_16645 [Pseudomonadota bacterium]